MYWAEAISPEALKAPPYLKGKKNNLHAIKHKQEGVDSFFTET